MIPSGLSNNRVKSIKSRFEVLSDQSKYGEPDLKLQNISTVPLNLKKSGISKENVIHKHAHRHNSESSHNEHSSSSTTLFENNYFTNSKDYLGASSNFGNRKRLKENDKLDEYLYKESLIDSNKQDDYAMDTSEDVRCNSVGEDISYDDVKENLSNGGSQKLLSRHHSDPVKKLHRSPAFRCERSEKIRDSRKNSFNSDCSDKGAQSIETDRCRLSRDKLKRLGFLLEEKMKQDNFEFSKPKNKIPTCKIQNLAENIATDKSPNVDTKLVDSNQCSNNSSPEKTLQDIKEQLKPIVYSGGMKNNKTVDTNNIHEAINDDPQIPKHILDQYAQVIKPKNRNAFMRKTPAAKIDTVLSDSGVSSESENLISDDLDESETSPKLKNFKAIRSNFEVKNTQGREDLPNRRKFLRRSSEDKKISDSNSSKENLIENDLLNVGESSNTTSFENKTFTDKHNGDTQIAGSDSPVDVGISDTLKKVLKQPLPPGPPPKKPPRTFAALQPSSPIKIESDTKSNEHNSKSKIKDNKLKSNKIRTKEESKVMLEKIENALYKHENGGKILSPRPVRKEKHYNSEASITDSWTRQGTKPSTAKLKKSHKKGDGGNSSTESKPKELHYMCTEIFDLNCPEMENKHNSSNASINSAESFQTTNSFTKCFNSLNCANTNVRHSSGINYTKLDSSLNSTTSSLNNVCCSCSFVSPKDKLGSSRNSMDDFNSSNQTRRLSTFLPSPSKSIENLHNISQNACETCGNNPTDQFVCHINSSNISNRSFSPHECLDESKSVFFVDRKSDSKSEGSSHYGVLKKSKSQEHIYAEPFEFKKLTAQHLNMESEQPIPKSNSSANVPLLNSNSVMKPPILIRTKTQLEDGFGKIREVDSTKVLNRDIKSYKDITASEKSDVALTDNRIENNGSSVNRLDNNQSKEDKAGDIVPSVELNDSSIHGSKASKVKDILMRLESGRASLRIENYKRTDDIRKSLAVRSNNFSVRNLGSVTTNNILSGNFPDSVAPTTNDTSMKPLHYLSTKIYDAPESVDSGRQDRVMDQINEPVPLAVNPSFLYGLEKVKHPSHAEKKSGKENMETNDVTGNFKRPPLYERKATTMQNSNIKARRPHSLYVLDNGRIKQNGGVVFIEPRKRRSPTEVDKEHLSRLMTEIYDTVAEACILEGTTATSTSGDSEHDTSDDVSLKLTRSLTEKRKRYVRRVTSRVGFLSEDAARIQRQNSVDDESCDDIPDHDTDANIKAYSTFPSRQSIKNASFLHSNINKENKMSGNNSDGRTVTGEASKQESKKEIISKGGGLFDACVLVGMNFSTGQAYIKNSYPEMVVIPPQIESLVFPESVSSNITGEMNIPNSRPMRICDEAPDIQCYALVLTNEKGLRTYGYCRRVLPEGATHCLPLSYCIISRHRAPAFYYKVLQEIECRHGSSENVVNSILSQLYAAEFPKPGFSVTIKQVKSPKRLVVTDSSFKKNSPYRNSVNLGDVLKSGSYEGFSGLVTSNSSSQSLLVDNDGDKFRRKSSGISANFPELKTNDLSVMKSLEKIYGENLKEFKSDFIDKSEPNVSDTASVDKDSGSKCSSTNLKSSSDNSSENLPSESSEGYRNDTYSHDTDFEDKMTKEYYYSAKGSDLDVVQIKRPLEPRLDEDNLSVLFESISVSSLVKIFGTLIIERKVVIVCDKLSQLSSCIEALQSILYPMTWQHTLVSSIPRDMTRDILEAPIPILAGLLLPLSATTSKHPNSELEKIHFEEGMLIDISNGVERLIKVQGDESTLLPPLLAKTLKASLQLGPPITTPSSPSDEHARKTRNVLVAEAFLRFFVEVLGDCKKYFVENTSAPSSPVGGYKGKFKFEKEQFIRSFRSKHVQYFLEWFTETAMFNTYIQQRMLLMSVDQPLFYGKSDVMSTSKMDLPYPDFYEMFDERVSRRGTSQSARAQLSNVGKESVSKGNYKMIVNKKVKVWRDKLRDLVS